MERLLVGLHAPCGGQRWRPGIEAVGIPYRAGDAFAFRDQLHVVVATGGEARGQSRNRASANQVESRFQNHPGGLESDREVSISGHSENAADSQGSRSTPSSLGNERRASGTISPRNESFR